MNKFKQQALKNRVLDIQNLSKNSENNIKLILFIIFLISLSIKAIVFILTKNILEGGAFPDRYQYIAYGEQIAGGNWNPGLIDGPMWVAPGLPLIVAFMKLLFNDGTLPTVILNMLLSSASIFILYYLGKELFDHKIGLIMAFWMAVYYPAIKFSIFVYKEALLYFFVPLTLFLLIKSLKKEFDLKYIILSALSYGILVHIDERYIFYLPVFPLIYFLNRRAELFGTRVKSYILWIVMVIILLIPWTVRNFYVFDQLVILSTRTTTFTSKIFGEDLYGGDNKHGVYYNLKTKTFQMADWDTFSLNEARKIADQKDMNLQIFSKREARLRSFFHYWKPTFFKPHFICLGYRVEHWLLSANITSILYYGIFLPFYFIGLYLLFKRRFFIPLFLSVIPILHSLIHAYLIMPLGRYRSPLDFIVAMIGLWAMFEIYYYVIHLREKRKYLKVG